MAPGPLTTAARGGFGFGLQHRGGNYGRVFRVPNTGRTCGPQAGAHHQRFYLDGSGHSVVEVGDKLTVSVTGADNDTDNGTVEEAADENGNNGNGNGEEEQAKSRSFFGRRDKMAVSSNSDGTVTIRPEGDAVPQIVGDPLSGAVTVVEIEPEALHVVDGRY